MIKEKKLTRCDELEKKVAVVKSQNVAFTSIELVFRFMHCPPEKPVVTRSDLRKPAVGALLWTSLS
jgi:hypothetical protein